MWKSNSAIHHLYHTDYSMLLDLDYMQNIQHRNENNNNVFSIEKVKSVMHLKLVSIVGKQTRVVVEAT